MENIVGHEKVKSTLKKLIEEDKVGHAYLFVGKEGIGKKEMAICFAKEIMNGQGSTFHEADFHLITPDGNTMKVEQVRNLIDEIYLKPTQSQRKVFVIDDAEKMNDSAQNALLKVLEEPPAYATIILIVANKEKIIKTILSRVTEIPFDGLSNEELKQIVGKEMEYDYARGSASKAFALVESDCFQIASDLVPIMESKDFLSFNKKMNEIKQSDVEIVEILTMLKNIYYQNLKEDTERKVKLIQILDQTMKTLSWNANVDLALDKMMLEICRS